MRVLLASDGSAGAGRARALVDRIEWPPETDIRVAGVLEHYDEVLGLPGLSSADPDQRDVEASVGRRLDDALEAAVRDLARSDRRVDRVVLRGHPAKAIVSEARDFVADLIVLGSRGHGAVRTALLGSVSADVVDHAPCPVLVARHDTLTRILLATDGSAGAEHAEHVLRDWPILAGRPVTVLCVADVGLPVSTGMAPAVDDRVYESYALAVDDARAECRAQAEAVAARLRSSGYDAVPDTRDGPPAEEVLAVARSQGVDLIVAGTRGHTGLARLFLGSVARTVLTHAEASVLIVRQKARVEPVGGRKEDAATVS